MFGVDEYWKIFEFGLDPKFHSAAIYSNLSDSMGKSC